ncbi:MULTISPECIES: DUF4440 domain-containing protein [unclassified Janthinobacterium]|uniref:DUF4440 domain-containing protein n=1 Tax=unclassified Janthinobacterium TaxID=2610881 RepID=UPI001616E171|nr:MULTISPECIES: DUF4440 domain-containing protein [unclassified Janthinobacterium]MBB5609602.1 hypothetical protein [Janthinobacterium sp. S3T4]MBB5614774.1 hypothetical protein [Janthinobacterium sp. S3M3]
MNHKNPYFDDVMSTHVLIRQWLGGEVAAPALCADLLARFSPDYSMVTSTGKQLDHASLTAFFSSAGGSRPGLAMEISELRLIQQSDAGATVSYREIQTLPGAEITERFSTVVYEKTADGTLLWRHLHETWAA